MNADLLRKWVDALESGEYRQAQTALRVYDAYCCLGVVCQISGEGKWRKYDRAKWEESTRATHEFVIKNEDTDHLDLPPLFRERLGLSNELMNVLVEANDDGETFPQIANRIRAMFPDVFATVPA